MVEASEFSKLAFFQDIDPDVIDYLAEGTEVRHMDPGEILLHQHDRAISLYFLLSGKVQFLIHVAGMDDLLVGTDRETGALIGWSVFRAPYRHTVTVRCETECSVMRIPRNLLAELMQESPRIAYTLLRRVAVVLARRLEYNRDRLIASSGVEGRAMVEPGASVKAKGSNPLMDYENLGSDQDSTFRFLRHATFFEAMSDQHLRSMLSLGRMIRVDPGTTLFQQGEEAEAFYLLVSGRVELWYCSSEGKVCIFLNSLESTGQAFGWSALVNPNHYQVSAIASDTVCALVFTAEALTDLCRQDPLFGTELMERVIWLIGNRLRMARTQLIARRYHKETLAVKALLEQNADTLHVTSPLHKIPYLLENRLTLSDAFGTLELIRNHGDDENERNLARLSLDILEKVHDELHFYQGLQRIYESVANAPVDQTPREVRHHCMQAFKALFEKTCYAVTGEEHLPDSSGHLFIMNHLENHADNMLPNDFRLTLDTHFVSSMLIYPKYHEAPIRVVKKPELDWYGFQQYFDRLEYLYVYPGEVDEEDRDHHLTRELRNRQFVDQALARLKQGDNIIICPEGRCYYTEESPGPFKAGVFRLALAAETEPLIVPIAVANFDKRLTRTCTAAIVFPPFRVSDHLQDREDPQSLSDFIQTVNEWYKGYVRQAIELAERHYETLQ
ncbi:cyclic nucleotide-binding domain-containing protein [Candidatus Thiodiazotropha sp. CDECU1]|uniref:cyclic nucleotide-binding domain-containing protein n=1 Tax=Candidatus Thiodiazotropha sp. CDECU1 TaxID=3065865 RepID=UPI002930613C|nr:cyclic nucleotide-binding domain-containing protein [Candidatus Thiodiazotropha sp. CDECU1]